MLGAYFAVAVVTFIQHKAVEAMVVAASLRGADACRMLQILGLLPHIGSVTNKHI